MIMEGGLKDTSDEHDDCLEEFKDLIQAYKNEQVNMKQFITMLMNEIEIMNLPSLKFSDLFNSLTENELEAIQECLKSYKEGEMLRPFEILKGSSLH